MLSTDDFIREESEGVSVIIRKIDGYVAMSLFCSQFGKRYSDMARSDIWTKYVSSFKDSYPNVMPHYKLMEKIPKIMSNYIGTYLHPLLMDYPMIYCCSEKSFTIKTLLHRALDKLNENINIPRYKELTTRLTSQTSLSSEFIQSQASVSEKSTQLIQTSTDSKTKGDVGEAIVFDLLRKYFPSLVDCHTDPHASDFYDPVSNIRFEIKTKKKIHPTDYEKIEYDDTLRRPNLTVLISNVDKIDTILYLYPNILTMYIGEFERAPMFWVNFITNSKWERSEDIVAKYTQSEFRKLIGSLEEQVNRLSSISNIPTENIIRSEPLQTSRIQSFTQIEGLKPAEQITSETSSSLAAYISEKRDVFSRGSASHHIKENYRRYCVRKHLIPIRDVKLFNQEMYKYCIQYEPANGRRPYYILRETEFGTTLLNNFYNFITESYEEGDSMSKAYLKFKQIEASNKRFHLGKNEFYRHFKELFHMSPGEDDIDNEGEGEDEGEDENENEEEDAPEDMDVSTHDQTIS